MKSANYDYKKICANIIKELPVRAADVINRRFGLKGKERETLESIGKTYDITRERVRQIEEEGFERIKSQLEQYEKVLNYFTEALKSFGGVKKEDDLLNFLGKGKSNNQVFFLLTLAEEFIRTAEDEGFYAFWAINSDAAERTKKVIASASAVLESEKKPLDLEFVFKKLKGEYSKFLINKDIFNSLLEVSKSIRKNPEGQIGLINWVEINPRGIKDKAYLVLKKAGKSLHFTEVAKMIKALPFFAQKEVHTATVHNELIKDQRFVLVGRGLYGLKEWGYEPGVVREIIVKVMQEAKEPMDKNMIIEKVLKQRMVKANTVFLNLQNKNHFIKTSDGKYTVKEA